MALRYAPFPMAMFEEYSRCIQINLHGAGRK